MSSANYNDFKNHMQAVYFDHKQNIKTTTPMEFLCSAELKYCTLYRKTAVDYR